MQRQRNGADDLATQGTRGIRDHGIDPPIRTYSGFSARKADILCTELTHLTLLTFRNQYVPHLQNIIHDDVYFVLNVYTKSQQPMAIIWPACKLKHSGKRNNVLKY